MGSTEFGNGGLFERERENPVKEKKKREAKEAEKSFKLKESRTRHALEELWCKTAKPQIELSLFAVFFIPFFSCYYIS